jgi:hypothetical protein
VLGSAHRRARRRFGVFLLVLWGVAAQALGLGSTGWASERFAELKTMLRTDRNPGQRRQAAAELGKLGDGAAVPTLVQSLLADRSDAVRAACAEALGQLGDAGARAGLKAAARDESERVQRLASAALSRIEEQVAARARPLQKVSVVVGRMGSKAKSGTLADIPKRLREAIIKGLQATPELELFDEGKKPSGPGKLFSVESSVTNLTRRTTPAGELEISCDVSVVIAMIPGRNIVGMVSGGASAFGPRGPSTKPTKALIENLETQALTQAVQAANESLVSFLRSQTRPLAQ